MTAPVHVSSVVIKEKQLLLISRKYPDNVAAWRLPTDTVSPYETVQEAAVRTALAQTGVVSAAVSPLTRTDPETGVSSPFGYTDPQSGILTYYVVCSWISGVGYVIDPVSQAAVAWCSRPISRQVPDCVRDPLTGYLDLALLAS